MALSRVTMYYNPVRNNKGWVLFMRVVLSAVPWRSGALCIRGGYRSDLTRPVALDARKIGGSELPSAGEGNRRGVWAKSLPNEELDQQVCFCVDSIPESKWASKGAKSWQRPCRQVWPEIGKDTLHGSDANRNERGWWWWCRRADWRG